MSVIFQALQKLDAEGEKDPQAAQVSLAQVPAGGAPQKNGRRVLLVCGIVAAMIILGLAAVAGVRFLTERVRSGSLAPSYRMPQNSDAEPANNDTRPRPVEEPIQQADQSRGGQIKESAVKYFPPEQALSNALNNAVASSAGTSFALTPDQAGSSAEAEGAHSTPSPGMPIATPPPSVTTAAVAGAAAIIAPADSPAGFSAATPQEGSPVDTVAETVRRQEELRYLAALEKSARMTDLARQLEHALSMQDLDDEAVQNLLNKLVQHRGQEHPYILKMQAFRLIRLNRLDQARELLQKILAAAPDDPEAGLNMAVVDLRNQRWQAAHDRLLQLRRMHPEHERIADMLRKVKVYAAGQGR